NVARFFDRKVALVHRTVAPRPELELPLERWTGENLDYPLRGLGVEPRIDAVALENGKPDFLETLAQLLGEIPSVASRPMQKAADVHRPDLVRLVEGFAVLRFGKAILLPLVHLIEADEILILCIDTLDFAVRHSFHPPAATIASG